MSEAQREDQGGKRTTSLLDMKSGKEEWDQSDLQRHLSSLADANFGDLIDEGKMSLEGFDLDNNLPELGDAAEAFLAGSLPEDYVVALHMVVSRILRLHHACKVNLVPQCTGLAGFLVRLCKGSFSSNCELERWVCVCGCGLDLGVSLTVGLIGFLSRPWVVW